MRALIIDDEIEIGYLLGNKLKKSGYDFDYAATIKTGKSLLSVKGYDLVFLDINLPDGSGLDLIKTIKNNNNTYLVVISAYSQGKEKNMALNDGADLFVSKPLDNESLNKLLARKNTFS